MSGVSPPGGCSRPGARERLDFKSIRLASHLCQAGQPAGGDRGHSKSPGQQINYGSGKDVSDETIADAGEPLVDPVVHRSYIELPVRR